MKQTLLFLTAALLLGIQSIAQTGVAINTTGADADNSAILDVSSTNKGFLPPRMTEEQRDLISSPVAGLAIWCSNCSTAGEMQVYNGTEWTNMIGGAAAAPFTCGNNITDSRDGKSYSTVLIGSQCWMAENLNVGTRINSSGNQTDNSTFEKYCYDDIESNCNIYGGLYQWNEMMQYVTTEGVKGICPSGWHLPTASEWTALSTYLGDEGGKLKEAGTDHWNSPNNYATNSSGFTGLPGGYHRDGSFWEIGGIGMFQSSTESSEDAACRYLHHYYSSFGDSTMPKGSSLSVRCIKD